jgi:hypothetical protein
MTPRSVSSAVSRFQHTKRATEGSITSGKARKSLRNVHYSRALWYGKCMSDVTPTTPSTAPNVAVRDVSRAWMAALEQQTPAGQEILEVLQGMVIALGMGGDNNLQQALDVLDRLRGNAPDEYTMGAIAMLMSVCQFQVVSPQQSLQILEEQLERWTA